MPSLYITQWSPSSQLVRYSNYWQYACWIMCAIHMCRNMFTTTKCFVIPFHWSVLKPWCSQSCADLVRLTWNTIPEWILECVHLDSGIRDNMKTWKMNKHPLADYLQLSCIGKTSRNASRLASSSAWFDKNSRKQHEHDRFTTSNTMTWTYYNISNTTTWTYSK